MLHTVTTTITITTTTTITTISNTITITIATTICITEASKAITPRYVERCLDHVYKYYTGCIQRKDLEISNL